LNKPTLDDVFVHFTGRGLKEENQDQANIPLMKGFSH
jgi:hypothetical protein